MKKSFRKTSNLSNIFNKNNMKLSYSFMLNISTLIIRANSKKLKRNKNTVPPNCNCVKKENCPLKRAVFFLSNEDITIFLSFKHHHHHHIVLAARISLTLSRHSSLSFIALGRSSGQQPVSSHSCWMYVRAGRPAFARPCVGIHKSTSLMSSSLLLQQCPACLVRLTWIVFVIGGRWPYSWCLVGCCRQDLFRIARSILV